MERSECRFSLIKPTDMKAINVFDKIGSGWILITAEHKGRANTMTASWGTLGMLWGKPVIIFFVRPQRFTCSLLEKSMRASVSFLGERFRDSMRICGCSSGRDTDKFKAASLTCLHYGSVPYVGESESVLICKKLYSDHFRNESFCSSEPLQHYRCGDYHKIYIYEIEKVLVRK